MGPANENPPLSEVDFEARVRDLDRAHRAHRTQRYRSLLMHWMGRWLRRPKRAQVAPLPTVTDGQVGISYAGHSSVLIRYCNLNIVCDPMLGRWVKGIKREVMAGLTAADLHDVHLILISHGQADHLHRGTLAKLPRSATVVLPPRTSHRVSDLGFARVVELSAGQSIQDHGVDIATAPARHGDGPDDHALSYVIRGNGPSVYFCGDSGYFSGFADIGNRYRPDIAILPIGGYSPRSFRSRHMSPLDALYALEDLGARVMIPIHHGTFALSYEHLREPSRWLAELVDERDLGNFVVELQPGESRVFVPPRRRQTLETAPSGGQSTDLPSPGHSRNAFVPAVPSLVRGVAQPLPTVSAAVRMQGSVPWYQGGPVAILPLPHLDDTFAHREFPVGIPEPFTAADAGEPGDIDLELGEPAFVPV